MSLHAPVSEEPRLINGKPEGQAEYDARCAIRDLIRLCGFEEARRLIAMYLTDEAEGKRQ